MSEPLSEQDFRLRADEALEHVERTLMRQADEGEVEIERAGGVLQLVFEDPPAKFVISPNAPVRQIWVSAMSRSFKLTWDPLTSSFVLDGEPLDALVGRMVQAHLAS